MAHLAQLVLLVNVALLALQDPLDFLDALVRRVHQAPLERRVARERKDLKAQLGGMVFKDQ